MTIRLRRYANGDAELVEVNGVAPVPRALLTADRAPGPTLTGFGSVAFGCASVEAKCTVEYSAFRSERVAQPVAGTLSFTRFRIRDTDSADRLAFRADYQLSAGSNGIDPAAEPVTITLSIPGWEFYSQTLNGFTVRGRAPRRRWTLNDAERMRTGIEQLVIDEDPNHSGGIVLRDIAIEVDDVDFGNVSAEIVIGTGALADKLAGTASLVERRWGSGASSGVCHKYGKVRVVRTTVDIPDQMYRRLKGRAAREGRSAKDLILRGVEQMLRGERRSLGRRVALPLIRSKRPGTVALDNARIYEIVSFP